MIDLSTTNLLLGILAGVALVQLVGLIVGGVVAWRTYHRTMERVDVLEQRVQDAISPFVARAGAIIDRLDRVSARVDHGTEKIDHALAVTSHGAQIAMTAVNGNVQRTAALAAALASGGRAAIRAWRGRGEPERGARPARPPRTLADTQPTIVEARPESSINHHRTEESHVSI